GLWKQSAVCRVVVRGRPYTFRTLETKCRMSRYGSRPPVYVQDFGNKVPYVELWFAAARIRSGLWKQSAVCRDTVRGRPYTFRTLETKCRMSSCGSRPPVYVQDFGNKVPYVEIRFAAARIRSGLWKQSAVCRVVVRGRPYTFRNLETKCRMSRYGSRPPVYVQDF